MKPLRLRMQAFGPYSESAEIDFRDLSLGGLFLIHGQTGAGKTSILDGLCFALFGKSSGSERSPEAMRCDLAKPDLATEVTLEFSLGIEIFKIVRRPRQQLKKKRGEGLTVSLPRGDLFKIASPATALDEAEWTLITSGDKKTDEKIIHLLGMTEEQFRQVVVLPQGQFRKFLSASSDDRENLLERLFRTSHYRQLAERLQRNAVQLESEIQAQRRDLNVQLAMANCDSLEALDEQTKALETSRSDLTKDSEAFQARYREMAHRRDAARLAEQLSQDLQSCEERRKELELRRAECEAATARLDKERRARPVFAFDTHVLQLDRELGELYRKIEKENENFELAKQSLGTLLTSQKALLRQTDEIETCRQSHGQLQTVYAQVKRFEQTTKAKAEAETAWSGAQARLEAAQGNLKELKEKQSLLRVDCDQLNQVLKTLLPLRSEIEIAKAETHRTSEVLSELVTLSSKRQRLTDSIRKTEDQLQNDGNLLKKMKIGFHLAQAATLAESLREQEPCPVCGNTDHPMPATQSTSSVSLDEIEVAETSVRKLSDQLASERSSCANHGFEIANHLARAKAESIDELRASFNERCRDLESKGAKLKELEAKEVLADQLTRRIAAGETAIAQAENALQKADADCAQAKLRVAENTARHEQLDIEIPSEWRDLAAITREGQILRSRIDTFEKEKTSLEKEISIAARTESAAQASLRVLNGEVVAKLSQRSQNVSNRDHALNISGLSSLDEARAGAMSIEKIQSDERLCRAFGEDLAGLQARLDDIDKKKQSLPEWAFDLETIDAEFKDVEAERSRRDKQSADLNARFASLTKLKHQVATVSETVQTLSDRYATLGKLAGVAMGQPPHNLSRVNFPRYILATRLDEVLDQASRRLFLMSRGQFSLRRAQSAGDKRKNAGLDLEVEDSFTGTRRSTASLSGGEGFLASLSLALGLADVVQSRLGGVRLEDVLVDEGLGTLDGEALEQAIKTLSELQAGGRLVGIISHVPELKDQIARRLFVQKSAVGSRVAWDNAIS